MPTERSPVEKRANSLCRESTLAGPGKQRFKPLSQELYVIWKQTHGGFNENGQSAGKKGMESAHQLAVDGFISLIRAHSNEKPETARDKILHAIGASAIADEKFRRALGKMS